MRQALLFSVCFALAGCAAPVGDFGRRDRGLYADAVTASIGAFSPVAQQRNPTRFPWTDEERELRHLGWGLVRPPDRDVPGSALSTGQWWRGLPDAWYARYPEAYWSALTVLPVDSHETRYERIIVQARADSQRMPAFRDAAVRVGRADGARRAALDAVAADAEMRGEAERRIAENRAVIDTVCSALGKRLEAYRFALARLMVETPSTRAVATDAAIDALGWETAHCRGGTPGIAQARIQERAEARSGFRPRGSEGPAPIK